MPGLRTDQSDVIVRLSDEAEAETANLSERLGATRHELHHLNFTVIRTLRQEREELDRTLKAARSLKIEMRRSHDKAFAESRRAMEDRQLLLLRSGWLNLTALRETGRIGFHRAWQHAELDDLVQKVRTGELRREVATWLAHSVDSRYGPTAQRLRTKVARQLDSAREVAQELRNRTQNFLLGNLHVLPADARPFLLLYTERGHTAALEVGARVARLVFPLVLVANDTATAIRQSAFLPRIMRVHPNATVVAAALSPFEVYAAYRVAVFVMRLCRFIACLCVAIVNFPFKLLTLLFTAIFALLQLVTIGCYAVLKHMKEVWVPTSATAVRKASRYLKGVSAQEMHRLLHACKEARVWRSISR